MHRQAFVIIAVIALGVSVSAPSRAADSVVTVRHTQAGGDLTQGGGWGYGNAADSVTVLDWGAGYRLDAGRMPTLTGGYLSGFGAVVGAASGEPGATYSFHLGAGQQNDRFSVNPFSRLGLAEVSGPTNDVGLGFTVSRSLTPNLSLTGEAEAHRNFGVTGVDPLSGTNEVVIGAGLGLRF
jgi:hypothetical protein